MKKIDFKYALLASFFIHIAFFVVFLVLPWQSNESIVVHVAMSPGNIQKIGVQVKKSLWKKQIKKKVLKKMTQKKTRPLAEAKRQQQKKAESSSENGKVGQSRPLNLYVRKVVMLIEQNKIYPSRARFLRQQGTVDIKLTLSQQGKVLKIDVIKPSAYSILTQSAINLIKGIGNFPSIPDEIGVTELDMDIPIQYKLQ